MQPTQVYETAIFDRDSGRGLSFLTIPFHALPYDGPFTVTPRVLQYAEEREPLKGVAAALGFKRVGPWEKEPGRLHAALDVLLAYPTEVRGFVPPSAFADYLAYEARIPVEASPVAGRTLTDMLAGGGIAYGIAQGRPLAILLGLGTIVVIGPVEVLGEWGTAKMRELLNIRPPD